MSKRAVAPEPDQDPEYVALVRLEGRDGFVEPGGVVRLTQASARVLLAAGLVMPGVGADDGPTVGADDDPPLRDDDPPIPTDAKAAEK